MATIKLFNGRPVYVLGRCKRADEGRVGYDVQCRPVWLGEGEYTFVTGLDCLDAAPTDKELRFVKASVRDEHAQGAFETRLLAVFVPVQGSHHKLMEDIITDLRAQGYETNRIAEHSLKRECVL